MSRANRKPDSFPSGVLNPLDFLYWDVMTSSTLDLGFLGT